MIIFFSSAFIAFGYAGLLFWIMKGWDDTPEWEVPERYIPETPITVIIAARNEEQYIETVIRSVLSQNFPSELIQLIVVDDQSTDATASLVKAISDPRLKLLTTDKSTGKKAAISLAINNAKSDLIICTDADCIAPSDWLRRIASGDDMMMVQKVANDYSGKVRFLKSAKAAVLTQPVDSIADLLMQRKRWATKSMHYADKGIVSHFLELQYGS